MTKVKVKNIYDKPLQQHSSTSDKDAPTAGYLRDGYCDAPPEDEGNHSVAGVMTDEFLDFTAGKGNDLRKQVPGLKAGHYWCLCAARWKEAFDAANGELSDARVPKVRLHATHQRSLNIADFKDLKKFAAEPESSHAGNAPQDPSQKEGKMVKESKDIGGQTP